VSVLSARSRRPNARGIEGKGGKVGGKLIVGVDTHKEVHAAAILDEVGRLIGTRSFGANDRGAKDLLASLDPTATALFANVPFTTEP
jgi:hypothetical protein